MSKPEWGEKRLCPSCSSLYYDLGKTPPSCPKCGTAYDPEALLKSRRRMTTDDDKKKDMSKNVVEEDIEDVDIDVAEEIVEEDDVVLEDDEDIEVDVDLDQDEKDQ